MAARSGERVGVVGAALDRERALRDLRQQHRRFEAFAAIRSARPSRSSAAAAIDDGVEAPALSRRVPMLPRSSANVRSGRRFGELGPAPHRAGRDPRARRAARRAWRPTSASRGSARSGTAPSASPGGGLRRQVLGRVDREVGVAAQDGVLDLLDEDARAAERVDRDVGPPVTGGLDDDELDGHGEARARRARAWSRASCAPARRDAQRRPAGHQSAVGRLVGQVEREELGQRVGVELATRRAGGVLQAHGRIVQELVDEAPA